MCLFIPYPLCSLQAPCHDQATKEEKEEAYEALTKYDTLADDEQRTRFTHIHICTHIHIHIHMYIHVYIYIYVYVHRGATAPKACGLLGACLKMTAPKQQYLCIYIYIYIYNCHMIFASGS